MIRFPIPAIPVPSGTIGYPQRPSLRRSGEDRHGGRSFLAAALLLTLLAGCGMADRNEAVEMVGGNPDRGMMAMRAYGCVGCHTIPGVPGFQASVGPSLDGIASRVYIAGVLQNTPGNMIRWIRFPQQIDSLTAMPTMGVTPEDARDISTYLYTLKGDTP